MSEWSTGLQYDFDILCTIKIFALYSEVSLNTLHLAVKFFLPSAFLFFPAPCSPSSLLCARRRRHTVLCHWVSLCFKTHNPVRSWHSNVHLMPIKILQSVHRYNELWTCDPQWGLFICLLDAVCIGTMPYWLNTQICLPCLTLLSVYEHVCMCTAVWTSAARRGCYRVKVMSFTNMSQQSDQDSAGVLRGGDWRLFGTIYQS